MSCPVPIAGLPSRDQISTGKLEPWRPRRLMLLTFRPASYCTSRQLPTFVVMSKSDLADGVSEEWAEALASGTQDQGATRETSLPSSVFLSPPPPPSPVALSPQFELYSNPRDESFDTQLVGDEVDSSSMSTPAGDGTASSIFPTPERTAMEMALEGLAKVLWASMGKRPRVVIGVRQAQKAADAIKRDKGSDSR